MDVTGALVAGVPHRNLRGVSREEFAQVWRAAEASYGLLTARPVDQARVGGLVEVCRWLAGVAGESPATRSPVWATTADIPDEIEAIRKAFAARAAGDPPQWTLSPPGRADGIAEALAWAWLGGRSPLAGIELPPAVLG